MNLTTYSLLGAGLLAALTPLRAADDQTKSSDDKKSLRVLAAPDRERRVFGIRESERREKVELEKVAFLGVETGPVSPTLGAQLGLARGTGLVVNQVLAKSPADGVLREHDILLQLDDQLLIETLQLSVLIRLRKEGDEVTLTYLRGGQRATAKVKLGQHEVPKMAAAFEASRVPFSWSASDARLPMFVPQPGGEAERVEVDRVLSLIGRPAGSGPARIQLERSPGPGLRAMAVNPGNSNLVFSDQDGALELTIKEGIKSLVATDAGGTKVFSGPVTTPEERAALPAALRERLERLEGMRDVTFRTDGDFEGARVREVRPRGISYPKIGDAQLLAPGVL